MTEDLRNKMIAKARENGNKHGKTAELDFGAGAEWMEEQLRLYFVSQQRELFNAILDFSEELPMYTENYHRSELWEKYKALNCG